MKWILNRKNQLITVVLLVVIGLGFFMYLLHSSRLPSCVTDIKPVVVRGDSLSGIFENGTEVLIYYNLHECLALSTGDIIIFNYTGNDVPLIKIVHGVPDDYFEIRFVSADRYELVINNKTVVNSFNQSYSVQGRSLLRLYADEFDNIVPANSYLVLGNDVADSLDSRRFGLIHHGDILGIVRN